MSVGVRGLMCVYTCLVTLMLILLRIFLVAGFGFILFYFILFYFIWEGLLHHKNSVLLLTIFLCLVMISNQVFQSLGYHLWLINRSPGQGAIRAVVTIC